MSNLPEPLVPIDCDCRGLPFIPFEHARLKESDFTALTTGDEFKAGVLLWCASWTECPSASLPDDDRILARKAGCSLADWRNVREMALHGWVKCSDGRLYHPVIADLAVKASEKRRGQADRANTRWAKTKAAKSDAAVPPHAKADAPASTLDATAMQVEVKGKVEETDANASAGRARAPAKPKSRRRCPADFRPSQTVIDFGAAEGLTPGEIERELAKMKDHEYRSPRSDWDAAARNWLRTAAENRRERSDPRHDQTAEADPRRANTESRRRAWAEVIAERDGVSTGPDADGDGAGGDDPGVTGHLRIAHAR